ncbi:MAG: GIN domain-containing protein, partial [Anaerolineae bacterium]
MKKQSGLIMLVVLLLFVSSLACGPASFGAVRGSGLIDTETHTFDNITGVELATFGDLTIAFGDKEELRIEAEDNLLEYFEITTSGGQVQIDTRMNTALRPTKPVRFYLTVKALDTIVLSGSGNVSAPDLDAKSIEVTIAGSGNVDLGDLEATTITLRISGSGNLRAAECVATDVDVRIPGSGDVD